MESKIIQAYLSYNGYNPVYVIVNANKINDGKISENNQ